MYRTVPTCSSNHVNVDVCVCTGIDNRLFTPLTFPCLFSSRKQFHYIFVVTNKTTDGRHPDTRIAIKRRKLCLNVN